MENIKMIVEYAGSSMDKIVKCTVLMADMKYYGEVNPIYAEYFPENPPPRLAYAVAGLPAGGLIEIECICIA
jgi:2-iminobutanoate/2-iminopropanoate deaminase